MATPAQLAEKLRQDREGAPVSRPSGGPPPLPPRGMSATSPPPYDAEDVRRSQLISNSWKSSDPRSSSAHSLLPSETGRDNHDGRRTLLLVYIHGFMGNETSFQQFPAHVHNYLTVCLEETHVVHTKIYPRYKSRREISFARDGFSEWLEPHENEYTDVVLLGHSMGGILSAEVALQPPSSPAPGKPFRHHILGTISFDTPFLGMHPGVVISGIGSLFRAAPEPAGARKPSLSGTSTPSLTSSQSYAPSVVDSEFSSQLSPTQSITSQATSSNDPYFNPPFPNDVRLPERNGWTNLLHFINKHSDGLTSATQQYFMSHIEFGGCLADYPGLKHRYQKIRAQEDVDELVGTNEARNQPLTRRIRFTNYYTASTGRLKAPKSPKIPEGHMMDVDGNVKPINVEMQDMTLKPVIPENHTPSPRASISVGENRDGATTPKQFNNDPMKAQIKNLGESSGVQNDVQEDEPQMEMRHIDSIPMDDDEEIDPAPLTATENAAETEGVPVTQVKTTISEPSLPPIPALPTEPEPVDLDTYTDKDSRKIAEKEQKRIMKAYQQAVKDRESAIKDRQKLVEKRERKARQDREKQLKTDEKQRQKEEKETEKQRLKEEKEEEKRKATINPEPREGQDSLTSSVKGEKPKRDKKFCMLPPEHGGKRDKCWVRVYMEGVDEVGAHCGLFFPGPQYESLVGDVGARIEKWIQEDVAKRAILETESSR